MHDLCPTPFPDSPHALRIRRQYEMTELSVSEVEMLVQAFRVQLQDGDADAIAAGRRACEKSLPRIDAKGASRRSLFDEGVRAGLWPQWPTTPQAAASPSSPLPGDPAVMVEPMPTSTSNLAVQETPLPDREPSSQHEGSPPPAMPPPRGAADESNRS